jgi:hypothetical protein
MFKSKTKRNDQNEDSYQTINEQENILITSAGATTGMNLKNIK